MPAGARPPHVLLIVLDAARRDAVAPYGTGAQTPTIATLAGRGVAMSQAYATAPWTLPSHLAMFTGSLASEFGLDQAPGGDPRGAAAAIAPLAERMLASRLAEAGYRTHGHSANLWVSPHSGLHAGFDTFGYVASDRLERAFGALAGSGSRRLDLAWAREGLSSRGDDGTRAIGTALKREIIDAEPGTPQFWFVNLVEAHSPYLPPRPFNDLGARERIRAALDCEHHLNFAQICVAAAGGLEVPARSLARLAHLHRRAVSYMDAWLAGILATLARRGMLEDTLVIVTSDHGEAFGEEGLLAHGFSLATPLVHVPLIAAGPGSERFAVRNAPTDDAASTGGAFSLRELPGVIAAATGLDADAFGPPGDGTAISRAAAICPPDDPRMLSFAAQHDLSERQIARLAADRWSATDGRRTLRLTDGAVESTGTDVGPQDAPDLLAALEHAARGADARLPDPAGAPSGGPPADSAANADAVAELERQMKLLGYM